jgi:anti-sigma factor RsiW
LSESKPNSRKKLLHYVSGIMSASDREAFEQRLIEDEEFSNAVEADEFDLVDDYAAGVLPHAERKQISAWIEASPERRARVLIARELHRSSSNPQKSGFSWIWWAAGLAACLTLAAVLPFLRQPQPPPPPASVATVTEPATSIPTDTILLAAERMRGSRSRNPANTYTVHTGSPTHLQIMIPPSARDSDYMISLQGNAPGSRSPLQFAGVRPQGDTNAPYLELTLPPGTLFFDHYTLELNSPTGSYRLSFNVEVK